MPDRAGPVAGRRVPRRAALHLFIDRTGLSMVGEGEWAAAKHGRRGRRGWKKLHLGVDHAGVIVAQALTDSAVDDASTGIDLIETIASSARTVTADAAYDTLAFYETANTRSTTVVVPPAKTAKLSRRNPRSSARDGTIRRISKIGRRRWKKEVGYHRQARVENAFFRYKSILGDRLRSRTRAAQAVESVLACNVLNRMTELGRPESFAIDRWRTYAWERSVPVSIYATTPRAAAGDNVPGAVSAPRAGRRGPGRRPGRPHSPGARSVALSWRRVPEGLGEAPGRGNPHFAGTGAPVDARARPPGPAPRGPGARPEGT